MNIIGTINLTDATEIIFFVDSYRGKNYGCIRKFIKSETYTGPTKKGISLKKANLEIILEALKKFVNQKIEPENNFELCKIPVYEGKFIVVTTKFYYGHYGLDIRDYFETKKYSGPSQKGVRIPLELLSEVVEYLEKMLEKIDDWSENSLFYKENKRKTDLKRNIKIEGVPDEYSKFF